MLNSRGQIADTLTWVVATTAIVVILILSILIVQFGFKGKSFDVQGGNSDLLVTKSFMGYLGTDNNKVWKEVKDKDNFPVYEKFSSTNFEVVKNIFINIYNLESSQGLVDVRTVLWLGLVKNNFVFQTGQIVGDRNGISSNRKAGVKIAYVGLKTDKEVLIELVLGVKEK